MAVHRYWRVGSLEAYAGGALALSEFQLLNEGARVDAAATLSSNIAPSSGSLANLQDDNLGTDAAWASAKGLILAWDFGTGGAADVTSILLGSTGSRGQFPAVANLQWSDDGIAWSDRYPSAFIGIKWPGVRTKTPTASRMVAGLLRFDKNWADRSTAGQTVYTTAGSFIHEVANGYRLWLSASSTDLKVRFASAPVLADFDATAVVNLQGEPSLAFRTTYWGNANDTYAYVAGVGAGNVYIGKGSNSASPLYTAIASTPHGLGSSADVKLRVTMIGSAYKIYVNDVLRLSGNDTSFSAPGEIGVRVFNSSAYFNWLQVREPEETHQLIMLEPGFVRPLQGVSVPSLGAMPPYSGAKVKSALLRARNDFVTGVLGRGIGRVRGLTLDYVNPLNKPYPCRVRLMREADGMVMRETWSGPDGSYDFQFIDELQSYTVVAYYLAHGKRAVVTDGLTLANGKVELMA